MARGAAVRLAEKLMRWGHRHPVFGPPPAVYTSDFVKPAPDGISPATRRELDDGEGFFARFEGRFSVTDLAGKDVLDLGCGFGGRTIYYALHGSPASIHGLEIAGDMVDLARGAAETLCHRIVPQFTVGFGEHLPYEDGQFDVVLSYDVFEHVQDLNRVLDECFRVLRPGGRVYALFPPYYGPRAHHLDYITTLPFLHYVFSVETLVAAVTRILDEHPELDRASLRVTRDATGKTTLPTLNGTTVSGFVRAVERSTFTVDDITPMPFGWGQGGRAKALVRRFCSLLVRLPWPFPNDIFTGSIRGILAKPQGFGMNSASDLPLRTEIDSTTHRV